MEKKSTLTPGKWIAKLTSQNFISYYFTKAFSYSLKHQFIQPAVVEVNKRFPQSIR